MTLPNGEICSNRFGLLDAKSIVKSVKSLITLTYTAPIIKPKTKINKYDSTLNIGNVGVCKMTKYPIEKNKGNLKPHHSEDLVKASHLIYFLFNCQFWN